MQDQSKKKIMESYKKKSQNVCSSAAFLQLFLQTEQGQKITIGILTERNERRENN